MDTDYLESVKNESDKKMHIAMCGKDVGLAVATTFVWALNVIFTKLAVDSISPLAFNFLRMVVVLPLMLVFPLRNMPLKAVVPSALIIGVGHYGLLALGLQMGAGAGITGLLLQLNPMFSTIAAALILKSKPNKYHIISFIPALAGIIYGCINAPSQGVALGYVYVLLSAVFMGIGNVYLKIAMGPDARSRDVTAFVVAFAPISAPILFLFMMMIEGPHRAFGGLACVFDWKQMVMILYAGWLSMTMAMKFWAKLLNKYSIAVVSPYSLLIPVFSLLLAFLIGEKINQTTLIAVVLIFIGLIISQIPSIKKIMRVREQQITQL